VPCPHFSNASGECLLEHEQPEGDDGREAPVDDPVDRQWCLSDEKGYRRCPVFQRFVAELLP
jgi:hypothetical protein